MPKSFLDTSTYASARELLFEHAKLLAVINCHKNTFQPYTGVRTSLLFIEKFVSPKSAQSKYPIFMGVSKKIGQDSEGVAIFKRDKHNRETDVVDHDLNEILEKFNEFKFGKMKSTDFIFEICRSEIGSEKNINPQRYLPSLNKTLADIEAIEKKKVGT